MSNWHHNRNVMEMGNPAECTPNDCSVQIKISSTAFLSEDSSNNFHFDKNGIIIPYPAFVWMCDLGNEEITYFINYVKEQYNIDTKNSIEKELDEEEEEEENGGPAKKIREVAEEIGKSKRSSNGKNKK